MDPIKSESRKNERRGLQHIGHDHPLVLFQLVASEEEDEVCYCLLCGKPVRGWSYSCNECDVYIHKVCAESELQPQLNHPFHPQHPITFSPKSPYQGSHECTLCGRNYRGFVYHCATCRFTLHFNCALLQSSMSANFPVSLHPHPLFFIENHKDQVKYDCSGCKKSLSGPIYHCPHCSSESNFNLHKKCGELSLEIDHSYDLNHPLTLLPKPPAHREKCSCDLCKIKWDGFVYSCSLCNIDLSISDFVSPTITDASHDHPWRLIFRKMSFLCDFCGTAGDGSPYLCTECNLLVHKKCISLPRGILITRHQHGIYLSYSLRRNRVEDWTCRICYNEVDMRYGCYCCSVSNCHYIAHVNCATHPSIWDGTVIPADYNESSLEAQTNLITYVFKQIMIGEQLVASVIRHAYHIHNLTLAFSGEINDDSQCDGCMRPISTPYYSCDQCKFFLHKDCAELPRTKRHPFHKHLLTLTITNRMTVHSCSGACKREYQGLSYRCNHQDCIGRGIKFDVRCMLLSDTLKHPSHEHLLFLVHNFSGSCSGCLTQLNGDNIAYRCTNHCDFTLDMGCATQPLTAWYKYDKHALTLTYSDDSDPSRLYCDLCENERRPNDWFYCCADCDNSLHSNCAIGDLPYIKVGNKIGIRCNRHERRPRFTLVKNIWNCPPCKVCGELCNGQALECKEPQRNFNIHWGCRNSSYVYETER
ncbi:Pentatricopeptide repeat superfamily protein [Hibiscus syriacus]|uniref:Pentatricopeptide repeat superfamily protein n=1 Tax=Hibiscus syriacus TaxID=106335 RepID=A0A6A3B9Y1_HIBSY|nr:uncharacterized protein LOC120115118 isoform X1 [Hibiscus syriacus]KAE8712285.1 Pentatricopeptide repeat superfamily protein [Hibiscus syriacus]